MYRDYFTYNTYENKPKLYYSINKDGTISVSSFKKTPLPPVNKSVINSLKKIKKK